MPWNQTQRLVDRAKQLELKEIKAAKEKDINQIADKIRILESSGGIHDHCLALGKVNGYGFRVNSREKVCYNSHKEVRAEVEKWLVTRLGTMPLAQALCLYNQGKKVNDCPYYKNYLKL